MTSFPIYRSMVYKEDLSAGKSKWYIGRIGTGLESGNASAISSIRQARACHPVCRVLSSEKNMRLSLKQLQIEA